MAEREFILPSQTAVISETDLARAREVRDTVLATVEDRRAYVERHGVDPGFAFPAANWARADGEVKSGGLFELMCTLERDRLSHLRAVVPFFTGYVLYDVRPGHEYNALYKGDERRSFLDYTDGEVADNLAARNGIHVERWERITAGLPIRCVYMPPYRFGEVGELRQGIIVNHDTVAYQERVGLLHDTGLLRWLDELALRQGELRVLEIGGGYGALGYWFKSAFRNCSYTIVDLPECLLYSALYLSLSLPDQRVSIGEAAELPFGLRFIPNYMAHALNEKFDLIVNTLSLSEMSGLQIRSYAELIAGRWLAKDGLFFEQNQDNRTIGYANAADLLAPYFPCQLIEQPPPDLIKGAPHIWSIQPTKLRPGKRR